jgi:large subunit ribosomal protein L21
MFAIVKTGGKQYQLAVNDKFIVEKIDGEIGSKITLNQVLAIKNEESQAVTIGSPFVDGATVEVEVVKNFKGKKIIIFKKRRRQNSRRKNGHRQNYTQLKVVAIKS